MGKVLGECPHCHAEVTVGSYGPYCTNRCGMMLNYAFGIKLDENQVWNLLAWRPIYVKGIKRKDGKTFNAYLRPELVVPYSYTNKQGEKREGFQYKFSFVDGYV